MWRLVKSWKRVGEESASTAAGCRLGPWAATVSREDERTPVLAIDVGTYLTVAFALGNQASFHRAFADALGSALEDIGVAPERIEVEMAAVTTLPLRPLADAGLRDALKTVDFMCGLELAYATDLRTVQRRLNDFPHNLPPYFVPEAAVRSLFGLSSGDVRGDIH